MTIQEYVSQNKDREYQIYYYHKIYCSECHKPFYEFDEEYSFDFVYADIGKTGYDWIFDDFDVDYKPYYGYSVEIVENSEDDEGNAENKIIIKVECLSRDDDLCPDCLENI